MARSSKILLGVTGSIAAYKAADIIRGLQKKNFDVTVVMTHDAARFISPLTLSVLSNKQVHLDLFSKDLNGDGVHHIDLFKDMDLFLVAPATANTIAKMACGIADNLLTCLALARTCPMFIAPAMNVNMLNNALVKQNLQRLKETGVGFIDPIEGDLACGTFAQGHLEDTNKIVSVVEQFLQ